MLIELIFQSELTLFLYILLTGTVFAGVQLLLCLKVKQKYLKCVFVYVLLVIWSLIFLMAAGVFGTSGGGFIGNEHLLGAAIFAILLAPLTVGVALAWVIFAIARKVKLRQRES